MNMENLSLQDPRPGSAAGPGHMGAGPGGGGGPQLPPQMFTTAASLLDLTDSASFRSFFPMLDVFERGCFSRGRGSLGLRTGTHQER